MNRSLLILISIFLFSNISSAFARFEIERQNGEDRFETSAIISENNFPNGSQNVVIATGNDFADALAGAPLAHKKRGPLLLTRKDALPSVVYDEIIRLNATNVTILGGGGAISSNIDNELRGLGISAERIQGEDRYETAALIAEEIKPLDGTAYIVTGQDFPDALSVSGLAAADPPTPILLVSKTTVPSATSKTIKELMINACIIIGGEGVVSASVDALLPGTLRIDGRDRYETSANIAKFAWLSGFSMDRIHIVSGLNFPDALSAGPIAGRDTGTILLTDPSALSPASSAFIEDVYDGLENIVIVGGEAAVSENVRTDLDNINDEQ